MLTCFVDEAGCPGKLPSIDSPVQPILVVAGISLRTEDIAPLSQKFGHLVQRYRHGQSRPNDISADLQREHIKGADVRRVIRNDRTTAKAEAKELPMLDDVLALLDACQARLHGTVVVKSPGADFDGRAIYSRCLMAATCSFHEHLVRQNTCGTVIADFREVTLNGRVSAQLFEAKLGSGGDRLPRLLHVPTFGNSEVHAPLQVADLICSALLWPIAACQFRGELAGSPCLHPAGDDCIRARFREPLRRLLPCPDLPRSRATTVAGHLIVPLPAIL